MPLKVLLKKKDKVAEQGGSGHPAATVEELPPPIITFMRSDTHTQEIISPPTFSSAETNDLSSSRDGVNESRPSRFFKTRARSASGASTSSYGSDTSKSKSPKRLSQRLHLRRSVASSSNVPADLPEITSPEDGEGNEGRESQWERRATILARENERQRSRPSTPIGSVIDLGAVAAMTLGDGGVSPGKEKRVISSRLVDDNIQEAIRLHEAGELEASTKMFGRLADPNGEDNALSQVLYGLALRHGWGCTPNPTEAVTYLSAAASNAAVIEDLALQAGMKKGGAAKGELVLAIFELANCFRHGWGVDKDPVAAQRYYETAANLGDTDAMNEVAWCYIEGFGCKKDKFAAAKYYRLAEAGGSKTLGNTWIWKEKYNPK